MRWLLIMLIAFVLANGGEITTATCLASRIIHNEMTLGTRVTWALMATNTAAAMIKDPRASIQSSTDELVQLTLYFDS
jgi:hypothetical protein